jgi:hypothetical protein
MNGVLTISEAVNSVDEKAIETIAFTLFLETWATENEGVSEFSKDFLDRLTWKWNHEWLPGRRAVHCGDCTKVCAPCLRCGVDRLFETALRIWSSKVGYTPKNPTALITSTCNCYTFKRNQLTGGWICPIHGQQF